MGHTLGIGRNACGGRDRERIHVLWVAKGLGPGGMERLLVHHAAVGDRSRFRYSVAYLVDRPHSLAGELEAIGVDVHRLSDGGRRVGWVRGLRRLVRDERVDVVHFHSPSLAAVGRPAVWSVRPRPAIVTTEHNSIDCYSWPTRIANVATYPFDDHRLAVSNAAVTSVPRLVRGSAEVLVHGIALPTAIDPGARARVRAELGIPSDAIVVITVANHRAEKAWDVLLHSARRVLDRRAEVVFLGVGQGPLEHEHRHLKESLHLGDSFRLLGFRPDVNDLLAASDVCCFASRQEGLPVALMEACAHGLPIIATAVGGLLDAVEPEVSGLLVAPEDPGALAAALLRVIDDDQLRARVSQGARRAAEQFDVRRAVAVIEQRYVEVAC